jgi:hypothetical protein
MDSCELKGGYESLGNKFSINSDLLLCSKSCPNISGEYIEYIQKMNSIDGVGFGFL